MGTNLLPELSPLWAFAVAAKVCLILALAVLTTRLMRNRAAAERHLVWVVAVAAVLMLPVLTVIMPALRVPVPAWLSWSEGDDVAIQAPVPSVTPAPAPIAARAPRAAVTPAPTPRAPRALAVPGVAPPSATAPVRPVPEPVPPSVVTPASTATRAAPVRRSAFDWLLVLWLAGVSSVVCTIVTGFVRVARYVRAARPVTDRALLVRAHGLAAELGVRRRVRLLEGPADAMPMTFGVFQPTLFLPPTVHGWTRARQEAVLRHELSHIRRHDSLTQLAAELACALHWFNPLVWLAARRMYVEREHACDDSVLVAGSRAADYAAELIDIARLSRPRRAVPLAAIAMARPSELRRRIGALLEERQRRAVLSGRLLVPVWVGAFALLLPISALAPSLRSPLRWSQPPTASSHTIAPPAPGGKHKTGSPTRSVAPAAWSAPTANVNSVQQEPANGVAAAVSVIPPSPRATPFAPVALAGIASRAARAAPQDDCLSRARSRSSNTNSNGRRTTIKWSGNDCSGEVVIDGNLTFDDDFTRIIGVSRGGSVRIDTDEGGRERRVIIRPVDGGLAYEYSVNGERASRLDAAGEQWLAATLLTLFRSYGLMATERATAILERRGRDALLTEIDLLSGDHARSRYFAVLVERGQLDATSLQRVLERAGNTLQSDHYLTEVITAVAGRYEFTDAVRQAYIEAASHLDSDHYKTVVLQGLLERELSPAALARVVDAAPSIKSDHYRAELLGRVASRNLSDAALHAAFVRAAAGMGNDHYKAEVLAKAAAQRNLDRAALVALIDAAATVNGDHYLSHLLVQIAAQHRLEGAARERFTAAMERIRSTHYRGAAADALVRQERQPR